MEPEVVALQSFEPDCEPVSDRIHAHLTVVHLHVLCTTVLGAERQKRLVLRANGFEQTPSVFDRNLPVILTVRNEEGALNLVGEVTDAELGCHFDRRVQILGPENPRDLKV